MVCVAVLSRLWPAADFDVSLRGRVTFLGHSYINGHGLSGFVELRLVKVDLGDLEVQMGSWPWG